MRPAPLAAAVLALALAASLQGCGKYGLKGDRGLPPPDETLAYPNLNQTPASVRPLKSPSEQDRIRAELDARKRQR